LATMTLGEKAAIAAAHKKKEFHQQQSDAKIIKDYCKRSKKGQRKIARAILRKAFDSEIEVSDEEQAAIKPTLEKPMNHNAVRNKDVPAKYVVPAVVLGAGDTNRSLAKHALHKANKVDSQASHKLLYMSLEVKADWKKVANTCL
jgi:hypothetical protein